jgi:SWI/SNF-related matrix-associated actin-dependent regulator of chromatin subfamily A member 5
VAILSYVYEFKKIRGPHLIVAPKSTISNWMKEFTKWTPFFKVVQLNPKMEVREQIIKEELVDGKFDVCLTTYEAINICFSALKKFKWQYFIVDEAHKLKNKDSKISTLSRQLQARNRLLLSGTPL